MYENNSSMGVWLGYAVTLAILLGVMPADMREETVRTVRDGASAAVGAVFERVADGME